MATILIVDDRPADRDVLRTALAAVGRRVLEAADGTAALAIARAERPDLVIADILAPTWDGCEFVRTLREDSVLAGTRVICYTAQYQEAAARRLAEAGGVSAVLPKPCDPGIVVRTVTSVLEQSDALRQATDRLAAILDLGVQLGSEQDPGRLVQSFCDAARQILGARSAIVEMPGGGDADRHVCTSGLDAVAAARIGRPGPLGGPLASAVNAGRSFRAANDGGKTTLGLPPTFPPARAVLVAPVRSPARVFGWACLLDKVGGGSFSGEDERVAVVLAAQVGQIFESARRAAKVGAEGAGRPAGESLSGERLSRLRSAPHIAHVGHWGWDPGSGRIEWSDEKYRLLGLDPKTTQPGLDAFLSVLHPDDRATAVARVQALLAGADGFANDLRVIRPGGEIVWIHSQARATRDAEGRVVYVEGADQDITHRKRAEAEAQQSADLLRAVANETTEAIFVKDLAGKYLLFNEAAARFVGKPAAEVLGVDDTALFDPAGARQIMDVDRRIMNSGEVHSSEETLTAAGTTRTYLATKGPYRDSTGKVAGLFGISRDITDRKRLERRLKTQHAVVTRLAEARDLREAAPDILRAIGEVTGWDVGHFWVHDPRAGVLRCLDYWHAEGVTAEEFRTFSTGLTLKSGVSLPGRVWERGEPTWVNDLTAETKFPRAVVAARAGLHAGFGFPIKFGGEVLGVIEFFSREVRPPDVDLLQMFDMLGSQIGQFVERMRAEQGLRLFRALIEQAIDLVAVADPETGRFLDANEGACLARGYTRAEFLALTVGDLNTAVAARPWAEYVVDLRARGTKPFEGVHYRKDGSAFPVEVNVNFIRLDREYLVAVVRDVSERKRLEDQYRQAQKMEAVGRLAGGVAHDFNNLLTIITGYSELIVEELLPADPNRGLMQEVLNAGRRAAGLTRQLLTFSRKAVIEPRVIDLKGLVADLERMLRRIIGEDIVMAVVTPQTVGAVRADPSQIEQVILNLVVNARDAMPRGGNLSLELAHVELDETYTNTRADARPGSYVLLAVADTGCGMDAATVARIFEPFFSTKGQYGTGLGLATVHGIVKQAGGHVAVYSEPGRGTTFKVYLPRVDAEPSKSKFLTARPVKSTGGETLLLVEDEDSVRALICHILRDNGYRVLEARDGPEAVQLAEAHRGGIHLLVTDVVMPRMDGPDVARQTMLPNPQMKVLYLSGYTDDAVFRHGILQSEVAFLQKPFTPAALTVKVREALDGG